MPTIDVRKRLLQSVSGIGISLLAFLGAIALVARFLEAAGRWLLKVAEVTAERGKLDIHARRGDLTGLAESREAMIRERRAQRLNGTLAGLLLMCLVLPLAIGPLQAYAIAVPLWLLPRRKAR